MERFTDAEYDNSKTKTKAEVIARLASKAYSNHMNGGWFMMSGIDTDLAAWILGEDPVEFYQAVSDEAEAIILHNQVKAA